MTIYQTLSELANQCVLCALCTPHCPTYQLFKTENESPRGRISLFKALAEEQLDVNEALLKSLDHCLGCRACEKVCPSQVDYAAISNLGRELIAKKYPADKQRLNSSLMQNLAEKLLVNQSLHPLLKLLARTMAPLQQLLGKKIQQSSIGTFTSEIAAKGPPLKEYYPLPKSLTVAPLISESNAAQSNVSETRGQVILFKGCSGDLFEQQNLTDTIRLLNACGFNVLLPKKQHCCGAIKLRHGDIRGTLSLAKKNISSFTSLLAESRAIVSISNSCSGQLKEYDKLATMAGPRGEQLKAAGAQTVANNTFDVIAFLHQALSTSKVKFAPLNQEIAVHTPCSLKNVLREEQLLFELLTQIPGIRLKKLNDRFCCGAAGSYMLQYPEVANRLLDDKIADIMQQNCALIVSSNIGCSLHFKQGLKKQEQQAQKMEVIHPVRLLARQLIEQP